MALSPPVFDPGFRETLQELFLWRRDVRRFKRDVVSAGLVTEILTTACLAPSVGNSQPWRFVLVETPEQRRRVIANFEACNKDALADYEGRRAREYTRLKLAGLREAPVHLAVFADLQTADGHGLGRKTMPETLCYSVVAAVHTAWLSATANGLGVGWVSILDADAVRVDLGAPDSWYLIAYLCVGYPEELHREPELQRHGWQARHEAPDFVSRA